MKVKFIDKHREEHWFDSKNQANKALPDGWRDKAVFCKGGLLGGSYLHYTAEFEGFVCFACGDNILAKGLCFECLKKYQKLEEENKCMVLYDENEVPFDVEWFGDL